MKEGWKTTEFWMTLMTNVIAIVGACKDRIPAQTAAIIIASANGVYGVLRTTLKNQPPQAPS